MSANSFSPEEKIVILDFGSQYTQVIARRVRECRVYSEILPYWTGASAFCLAPKGIILSGGPASVYAPKAPKLDKGVYELGIPILGICYGLQLIASDLGGAVERSSQREYGPGKLRVDRRSDLFRGLPAELDVWNSHGDNITKLPEGFRALGRRRIPPTPSSATSSAKSTDCSSIPRSLIPRAGRSFFKILSIAFAAANRSGRWARLSIAPARKFPRRSGIVG